ncbi:hypothetical protein LXA43DRAFT_978226 [Ganoderma leucocontextum]|nr:hypothetical protein LXA43DRAFT_978226 [Ganoderma leucocontextum]
MSANAISNGATNPSPQRMAMSHSTSAKVSSAAPSSLFSRHSPSSAEIGDFAIVPPSHAARTLVFCFGSTSGLGRKYGIRDSNLYRFFMLLNQNDRNQQMCFHYLPKER